MTTIDYEPKPGEPFRDYANRLLTFTMGCQDCAHEFTGSSGDTVAMFRSHRVAPGKSEHRPWREVACACGWASNPEYRDHAIVVAMFEEHLQMHAGLRP